MKTSFYLFLFILFQAALFGTEMTRTSFLQEYDVSAYCKLGPVLYDGIGGGVGCRFRKNQYGLDLALNGKAKILSYTTLNSAVGSFLYYLRPEAPLRTYMGIGVGYTNFKKREDILVGLVRLFDPNYQPSIGRSRAFSTELMSGIQLNYWRGFRPFLQCELEIPTIYLKKEVSIPTTFTISLGLGF